MEEITLEKVDIIKERTGVTYTEAKEALEASEGNVIDALIYIENNTKSRKDNLYETKDEFVQWIKDTMNKGNVSRIRVKKDDRVILDIPVAAGVAGGVIAGAVWAPSLAIMFLTAVFAKVTVEITKQDGSVEVVNKVVKNTVSDVKDKINEVKDKVMNKKSDDKTNTDNAYQYTVKFDEVDGNNDNSNNNNNNNQGQQ
ncbi:ABC-type antimicrobial peptide transport system permease subunit [Clostridium acetobutylicum]|uniref:N-terminal of elongation factor Ts n=1 Tax=Clostridium acetobutylicum (strain ATCC 824 / DSM 792 / JCM 1419 / IAM 19013 / LMG 5710 / NBRC 13948 / NRRL B-527 / VKM B-1787 / 2291 / W) TaxID=272562 RepID=Q97JI3_CLOAB|nr:MULTISPECIES: DUF4342 domain-containing protein [Clostridium]AAK79268.1 N-terminal fragment of elongation factor Ts [Clostridium acetobutylicum ATCC 824]ADZ20347.1 elongation factor Ts [Clostridium acetobutylicum EA 2018]AEI31749.1 elongation factor Ts [Clostridium acetobutylicum DSM 1731]AWV81485.1 DUF4342 domain-containing protein [Clostridium acetobutylicum]MBC2393122.1 DUF4342 domain-containing protein [Clostridium acetobutylicum]